MGGSVGMTRGGPWRSSGGGVVPGGGGAGGGGGHPTPWRGWDGGPPQDRVGQRRSQQSDQQTVRTPGLWSSLSSYFPTFSDSFHYF